MTEKTLEDIEKAREVISKTVYDSESPESLNKLGFDIEWMSDRLKDTIKELKHRSEVMERGEMVLAAIRGVAITTDPHYFDRRKINIINQLIGEILPVAVTNEIALWALKKREVILNPKEKIL